MKVDKGYLVSAIVSMYKSERFIRGCLDNLLAQTIADRLEIVVVNSNSPQNEEVIIQQYVRKYPNIKYLRTPHRETVYGAWNRGIKAATGSYVTNANTDDRHRNDAFELMAGMLEQRPAIALVYADVIVTETENETFAECTGVGIYRQPEWSRDQLLRVGCFMGPQPMWRRNLHDEYGYFDETFVTSGDYEFWLRISQTHDFAHLPKIIGLYLRSPAGIELSNLERQKIENEALLQMYREAEASRTVIRRPFQANA